MKKTTLAAGAILMTAIAQLVPAQLAAQAISFENISMSDFRSPSAAPAPVPSVAAPQAPKSEPVKNSYGVFTYQDMGEGTRGARKLTGVDLLPQFADSSTRDQGNVGSCHAFGSMAVMEAAYYRANGKPIKLSEADIFMRKTVTNGDVYRGFAAGGGAKLSEGNDTAADLKYAQKNGVASSMEYEKFLERYQRYRDAEQRTLSGIAKEEKKMDPLTRMLYNPRKHWAQLQKGDTSKKLIQRFLTGGDPAMDEERTKMKEKMKDFKIETKAFKYLGSDVNKMTSEERGKSGEGQKKLLMDELSSGRPVTVSMSLSGLKAWGQTDTSQHANHAFMIVGFKSGADGQTVFKTRNSWGGHNPDIKENELCRIYGVSSVKIPGE